MSRLPLRPRLDLSALTTKAIIMEYPDGRQITVPYDTWRRRQRPRKANGLTVAMSQMLADGPQPELTVKATLAQRWTLDWIKQVRQRLAIIRTQDADGRWWWSLPEPPSLEGEQP